MISQNLFDVLEFAVDQVDEVINHDDFNDFDEKTQKELIKIVDKLHDIIEIERCDE